MVNKTNEKDQLSNLNTRFQSYIQKVRFLEEQNKKLETKIKDRTAKATEIKVKPEHIEEIFQLRENIDDLTVIKAKLQVERDNLQRDRQKQIRQGMLLADLGLLIFAFYYFGF